MRGVFADTVFWLAITGPRDQWHDAALRAAQVLSGRTLVTTDEVLTEFIAGTCRAVPDVRHAALQLVHGLLGDPEVEVVPQSRQSFLDGLTLYEQRPDKTYSLTDCISMQTMWREGLTDVLTNDRHFEQEGFTVLMRLKSA